MELVLIVIGVGLLAYFEFQRHNIERKYREADWLKDYMESKGYDWD